MQNQGSVAKGEKGYLSGITAGLLAALVVFPWLSAWAEESTPNQDDPQAIRLFDGETLNGWVVKCRPQDDDKRGYWKVVDGTIMAEVPEGSSHNYIWLVSEKEFADFELSVKVQTFSTSSGNSGIQVRSRYDDQSYWMDGPQIDINPPGPWRSGFIYDETRGAQVWLWPDVGKAANAKPEHAPKGWKWFHADAAATPGAWNDLQIVCNGFRIQSFVNDVLVADYSGEGRLDDDAHRLRRVGLTGHIALQIHPGGTLKIRFKDIVVRPIRSTQE
ncbi:MAG: 3-keto-disaccharide hydrolase [Thermogutta sp.]